MFCSHCGEKLIDNEQRFCQICGTEILTTYKTTYYKPERIQSVPAPKIIYVPQKQRPQSQWGLPGKYSKLCLWLALGSTFIGILSLIIGYNYYRFSYFPYNNISVRSSIIRSSRLMKKILIIAIKIKLIVIFG
ncbi:unnamed protein product, partial [marine sediment metagenome]